ncbi:MAG: tetratricopeptide repeat protein, partial [Longimicrobiales bacterium]|nr:tetratricopeptide repeat protein [Longimicrobiales bacterium]
AWLSMDQGKPEEAESRFGTALELDPHNISALRGLAEILLDRGQVDSALGLLDTLLREDPVDLDLPDRILALRAQVDARTADLPGTEIEPKRVVWDDPDAVAEEVNWEVAVLQPDSSRDGASEGSTEVVPSVSVVEDGEPIPAPEELDDALVTSTLGEIYLRQGLFDRAERVFQTLLERDPENDRLKHRLEEVQGFLKVPEAKPFEGKDSEGPARPEKEVVPIASLAPDDVPDAAGGDWAPGDIVPIQDLAPVHVVPIESLAPDRLRPSLAEGPASDRPVSIDSLAPDEFISIGSLAPDEFISIDSLAPDGPVPIESLAPDHSFGQPPVEEPDKDDSGGDPTLEGFENWLDGLQ